MDNRSLHSRKAFLQGYNSFGPLKGEPPLREPCGRLKKRTVRLFVTLILIFGIMAGILPASHADSDAGPEASERFDIVVYGGTPAGIAAAVAAAREGAIIALVEPGLHLGGMMSSGLCATDKGRGYVIGGLAREFYRRVGRRYGKSLGWNFEPHVAEEAFNEMLREAGVSVFLNERLREGSGVQKVGARVEMLIMESGRTLEADVFIDCTYEGDLMAQAGVSYAVGRESSSQYGESLAGVRPYTKAHNFVYAVPAYNEYGDLLPEISHGSPGEVGSGDEKIQAYNYRVIITNDPSNMLPFPKPENYDPSRYRLLAEWLRVLKNEERGRKLRIDDVLSVIPIPGDKADANNNGPFSTDYLGGSWGYPEAGYAERERIQADHRDYTQGLLYFLANDPSVPAELREDIGKWGLPADEFTDNGGWPYQLYIREARRMVGEYVMTQKDIRTDTVKYDSIGMGSYNSDSHNTQRYAAADGTVLNEGDMQVPVKPYQIPYRALLPKRAEAENLIVPVCLSASHVAYSTLRMEPQFMIMGEAAGVAAAMSAKNGVPVQDVDIDALREKLKKYKAVLENPMFGLIALLIAFPVSCAITAAVVLPGKRRKRRRAPDRLTEERRIS
jgi:hypothetical protein